MGCCLVMVAGDQVVTSCMQFSEVHVELAAKRPYYFIGFEALHGEVSLYIWFAVTLCV